MNTKQTPKLNKADKLELRMRMAEFEADGGVIFQFPDMGVTVACGPMFKGSDRWLFTASEMGKDETKFRPKVGKFVAIRRWQEGQTISVDLSIAEELRVKAIQFAEFLVY